MIGRGKDQRRLPRLDMPEGGGGMELALQSGREGSLQGGQAGALGSGRSRLASEWAQDVFEG